MRFRKGLLQRHATSTGYMPVNDESVKMIDWVKSSGGRFFERSLDQMVHDDAKAAHLLEVMYGSAFPLARGGVYAHHAQYMP